MNAPTYWHCPAECGGDDVRNPGPGFCCPACGTQMRPLHRVFVYGILKTREHCDDPPESACGVIYANGIALCRFDEEGVVRGEIRTVDDNELADWDRIEGVASGMYSRIVITTDSGQEVYAYQYERDRSHADIIADGIWGRGNRGYRW